VAVCALAMDERRATPFRFSMPVANSAVDVDAMSQPIFSHMAGPYGAYQHRSGSAIAIATHECIHGPALALNRLSLRRPPKA
jgi:hypothetical protein